MGFRTFISLGILSLLFFSCAHKSKVRGSYVALYQIPADERVTCHFLMKLDEKSVPSTLCHNEVEGWVTSLKDYAGQDWAMPPVLTQSGSLISFLEKSGDKQITVLISSDKGKYWDIYPSFTKKNPADKLKSIAINNDGKLIATFEDTKKKKYEAGQEASLKAKFTPVKKMAGSYPTECFNHAHDKADAEISATCMPGYLERLVNQ